MVIQSILPLIPLYLMKLLLDSFATGVKPDFSQIVWILVAFAILKIVGIILSNIQSYIGMLQGDILADYMSNILIRKSIKTDLEYFDSDDYHDIFSRALGQGGRPLAVLGSINALGISVFMLIVITLFLFTLHWLIPFALIFVAIPVAYTRWYYSEKNVELKEAQTQRNRKAGYFQRVLTHADYVKEVRVFDYGRKLLNGFLNIRKLIRKERRNLFIRQMKSVGFTQSIESVAIIGALGFITYRAIEGALTVGDIAMYFGAFQKGQANVHGVLKGIVSMNENRLYLGHLFSFLDLESKIKEPIDSVDIPKEINELSVENVSFTYPNTEKEVLKDVSFTVKKGEMVAIVGENGSGKTTLLKLINRLYALDKGKICFNKIPHSRFKLKDLRKRITVIFQLFSKYNATVKENIQFADLNSIIEPEEIQRSGKLSLADGFIQELPNQYNTQLGRSFRAGEELSGGQWQKIALSRAFYKKAEVIILDEPTSFIDPLAEDQIFSNLKKRAENKILIIITHRIYNLKQVDKIIVMKDGSAVEQGSHKELVMKNGLYKRMFEAQV